MKMTKTVQVGSLKLGGGNPILVQSMTNTDTRDVNATLDQIQALSEAGCDLVRVSVYDEACARAVRDLVDGSPVPLVADIHFDYRLAIAAMENGIAKLRINPGNIGGADRVRMVADCAKAHHIPIRIGVNSGSAEKELLEKYGGPLHVGVTEAGLPGQGTVKSAIGIGSLLLDGIGDTIRVSLSGDPVPEAKAGWDILRALDLRTRGVQLIACPTCGRTGIPVAEIAARVERDLSDLTTPLKVAVMGCIVNGIGEGKEADIGIAGGKNGAGVLFVRGREQERVQGDLAEILIRKVREICPEA